MDLDDSALGEMGFKRGQRMKILKIIESVKVCVCGSDSLESIDDSVDHTMSIQQAGKDFDGQNQAAAKPAVHEENKVEAGSGAPGRFMHG